MILHLLDREMTDLSSTIVCEDCVYFLLYNLSGQLVGVQRYNPTGNKVNRNEERRIKYGKEVRNLKYVSYVSEGQIGIYGLHTYRTNEDLYIVEGVFDCTILHNLGLSAIAVLTSDPKPFRSWLNTLPNRKIAIPDNDDNRLTKYGDISFSLPSKVKDLNQFGTKKTEAWITENLQHVKQ